MKKTLIAAIVVFSTVINISPARAGELSVLGASISWDESKFYIPTGCSKYDFKYSAPSTMLIGKVVVLNAFGDSLGSTFLGDGSGTAALQVCALYDFTSPKVVLEVDLRSSAGGLKDSVSAPISFRCFAIISRHHLP